MPRQLTPGQAQMAGKARALSLQHARSPPVPGLLALLQPARKPQANVIAASATSHDNLLQDFPLASTGGC